MNISCKDTKPFAKEFSKNAKNYNKYNIIQKQVAKKLISFIKNQPKIILDLGCGSGELYRLINWDIESFTAVDISKKMCELHPKGKHIKVINANYEDDEVFDILKKQKYDIIISSSSLQWCNNLEKTIEKISKLCDNCVVSIFCDGTFKTIYQECGLDTFLPDYKSVVELFERYFDKVEYEVKNYKLYFKDNLSKFRYIKKSGVSGGKRKLGYKETKNLIKNYPLDYLEFEVLYIKSDAVHNLCIRT